MAYSLRTRFKKEIVAEFMPPKRKSGRVAIILDGMPGVPSKKEVLQFLSGKGFWAIHPRYRGAWESGGKFLRRSPEEDVHDVIDDLPRGLTDFWSGKKYRTPKSPEIFVIGSSFGGPASILSALDRRVAKAVAFSPVVDWRRQAGTLEPLPRLGKFTRAAFGEAYRFGAGDWNKLGRGPFYSPVHRVAEIDGAKLLIIHAKDDEVVPWRPSEKFAKNSGASFWLLARGGHLSSRNLIKPRFWKRIAEFLRR